MSPEAQRTAIANAHGWTKVGEWDGLKSLHGHKPGRPFSCLSRVPDYPADLNAMHEAETVLTVEQQNIYAGHLMRIVRNTVGSPHWCLVHASAAQRAEAFLETLNLWTDQ